MGQTHVRADAGTLPAVARHILVGMMGLVATVLLCVAMAPAPALGLTTGAGSAPEFPDHLNQTVSPNGTTINLYDYWLVDQSTIDTGPTPADYRDIGINAGHDLRFLSTAPNETAINRWTRSARPQFGIVRPVLGADGFPQLASGEGQSLAYLFDRSDQASGGQQGKVAHMDVANLLRADGTGYYVYDATQSFASYNAATNAFDVYDTWGVKHTSAIASNNNGQLFPFNAASTVLRPSGDALVQNNVYATSSVLNHWFGLTMTSRFVQQDGGTNRGQQVTYGFSGDDDVWIFIDGVLVGDLGGIHNACAVTVNFATGQVLVFEDQNNDGTWNDGEPTYANTTIRQQFAAAGREGDASRWRDDTFADDTYHTLNFYYLERGNGASNMRLRYNLVSVPESDVIKVDQESEPIAGAGFALFTTDASYTVAPDASPSYTGTTDANGMMRILDANGFPASLEELGRQSGFWVLRETSTPEGYRNDADIPLYFDAQITSNAMLLSADPWTTGAYAQPKMAAATTEHGVYAADGTRLTDDAGELSGGLMFAVVMHREADGSWHPVVGDALSGWSVLDASGLEGAAEAAARGDVELFSLNANGLYEAEVENMPGDIKTYSWVMRNNPGLPGTPQYAVAFFYTSADRLGEATAANSVQVRSETASDMERQFATRLYVTNIENRMIVQKTDEAGQPVAGAEFSLFRAADMEAGADGSLHPVAGATPVATGATGELTLVSGTGGSYTLSGATAYSRGLRCPLEEGSYYLVETAAPEGFAVNPAAVAVVIDSTGVYADAGTAGDGVTVARGVGRVVGSMQQFTVDDDVDTTLHDIKAALVTAPSYEGAATPWSASQWDAADAGHRSGAMYLEYSDPEDPLPGAVFDYAPAQPGGVSALETDTGWSKLVINQWLDAPNGADPSLKKDLGTTDLAGIYSGTVVVRVADKRVQSLTIAKNVTVRTGSSVMSTPADRAFEFSLEVPALAGKAVEAELTGPDGGRTVQLSFDATGAAQLVGEDGARAPIALRGGEAITVPGIVSGSAWRAAETTPDGAGFALTDIEVDGVAAGSVADRTASGTIGASDMRAEFTNTYTAVAGESGTQVQVQKTLLGRAWQKGEAYTFELEPVNAPDGVDAPQAGPLVLGVPEAGQVAYGAFDALAFTAPGTYVYRVTELEGPQDNGMTYDGHASLVTITVRDDGAGSLVVGDAATGDAGIAYDNSAATTDADRAETQRAAFTNVYTTGDVDFAAQAGLQAVKTLDGGAIEAGAFQFRILPVDGADVEGGVTAAQAAARLGIDAAGGFTAEAPAAPEGSSAAVSLLPEGAAPNSTQEDIGRVFCYRVFEVQPTVDGAFDGAPLAGAELVDTDAGARWRYDGVVYDSTVFDVRISVRDAGDGVLAVDTTVSDGAGYSVTTTVTSDRTSDPGPAAVPFANIVADAPDEPGGGEEPGEPGGPEDPGNPDGPDKPGEGGEPSDPDSPDNPAGEEPDNPINPDTPNAPSAPNRPQAPSSSSQQGSTATDRIPQTGDALPAAAAVLAAAGIALAAAGAIARRRH